MAAREFGEGARRPSLTDDSNDPVYNFDDQPTVVQKTPVSYLQEICLRAKKKPEFTMVSAEGQSHDPTFVFRVTIDEMTSIGQGKSKQTAKHIAARALLAQIIAMGKHQEFKMGETLEEARESVNQLIDFGSGELGSPENSVSGEAAATSGGGGGSEDGGKAGNPVGKLQELCQREHLAPPVYEVVREEGMPHERNFVVSVSMGSYTVDGSGRSKKNAKREGAEKMLKFLDHLSPAERRENIATIGDDELAENCGDEMTAQGLDNVKTVVITTPSTDEKWCMKKLKAMNLDEETPSEDHTKMLKLICDDENWKADVYPMPRRSKTDEYQCLIQLNLMPVAVCYGRGATEDAARESAAYSALEYLKLSTDE